jgi:hypothetical protein
VASGGTLTVEALSPGLPQPAPFLDTKVILNLAPSAYILRSRRMILAFLQARVLTRREIQSVPKVGPCCRPIRAQGIGAPLTSNAREKFDELARGSVLTGLWQYNYIMDEKAPERRW